MVMGWQASQEGSDSSVAKRWGQPEQRVGRREGTAGRSKLCGG